MRKARPYLLLATAAAISIAALQWQGGAYQAEFTGAADEPSYFVTSLMVRDYLGLWPKPAPLPWAEQYYIHYPKVAFGHWPPGHFVLQSAWWIVFPATRTTALWFNVACGVAIVLLFFSQARRIRAGWPAWAAAALLLAAPVMQEAMALTMAEGTSLLAAVLFFEAMRRWMESPSARGAALAVLAIGAVFSIKATAVALVPGAVLVVMWNGAWRQLLRPWAAAALTVVAVLGALLMWLGGGVTSIRRWGGLGANIPWRIDLLPDLGGWGLLILACGGVLIAVRHTETTVRLAAAQLCGMVVTSYFVRAMREPRHWIFALPVVLLLALAAYHWLERRTKLAPVAAVLVAALVPFGMYRQQPAGFTALAGQLRTPERMLISSPAGWTEGGWIAVLAEREQRPASTILRATKTFAQIDWNGNSYKPLAETAEQVDRKLDESGVNIVVLHDTPAARPHPHHKLLADTLRDSASWRRCGEALEVSAYCRAAAPRYAPLPVRIDLRRHIGKAVEEAR